MSLLDILNTTMVQGPPLYLGTRTTMPSVCPAGQDTQLHTQPAGQHHAVPQCAQAPHTTTISGPYQGPAWKAHSSANQPAEAAHAATASPADRHVRCKEAPFTAPIHS